MVDLNNRLLDTIRELENKGKNKQKKATRNLFEDLDLAKKKPVQKTKEKNDIKEKAKCQNGPGRT